MRLLTWNIARREAAWRVIQHSGADVALLQEAISPPLDIAASFNVDPAPWRTAGGINRPWRTAIAGISQEIELEWLEAKSIADAADGELGVSRIGTITAAIARHGQRPPLIIASVYGLWERPHRVTNGDWIYADASIHRIISDLSTLIGRQNGHRLLVAGDFNILYGYGEHGSRYWAARYETIFNRMTAIGLKFVGPQAPHGRQADPWPEELPQASMNVPTYHTTRQKASTSTRQLDFVFSSADLAENVRVKALNQVEEWGPSDHCRVEIEVQ